jgi:hypothetical protein
MRIKCPKCFHEHEIDDDQILDYARENLSDLVESKSDLD